MKGVTMAITESDAERQARIEADIRRLFARYRRATNPEGSERNDSVPRSAGGRFGPGARPVGRAQSAHLPRAR
jgi:hypothetical protein